MRVKPHHQIKKRRSQTMKSMAKPHIYPVFHSSVHRWRNTSRPSGGLAVCQALSQALPWRESARASRSRGRAQTGSWEESLTQEQFAKAWARWRETAGRAQLLGTSKAGLPPRGLEPGGLTQLCRKGHSGRARASDGSTQPARTTLQEWVWTHSPPAPTSCSPGAETFQKPETSTAH